ncbi:tRNA pseudouridine(13) synthase TruD [Marinomonas agarivorans]|nr:tRNA pseudouridine(13) synthase TruD [Marinomonas agarivorans]
MNNTNWHYAWSTPQVSGELKTAAQDFYVEEVLDFTFEGTGEFLYLYIEKQGMNTDYLAKLLAKHADLPASKVTYSGVKDRHAVTRQWFCLHVLNKQPDFTDFMEKVSEQLREHEVVRIIKQARHLKKLKIGSHKKNHFIIRLRRLDGPTEDLENRLALVSLAGVPNYFGPQRFGIDGNNLKQGIEWLSKNPNHRRRLSKTESFWVSAVRSWFFNQALSEQVKAGIWNRVFVDDRVQTTETLSQRKVNTIDASLLKHLHHLDLHPLMPLANETALQDTSSVRATCMKQAWVDAQSVLDSLLSLGLNREDRPTRLHPENMQWQIVDTQLILQFTLPKGSFATSVLRELLNYHDHSGRGNDSDTNENRSEDANINSE